VNRCVANKGKATAHIFPVPGQFNALCSAENEVFSGSIFYQPIESLIFKKSL
jgi:hypothetical protein